MADTYDKAGQSAGQEPAAVDGGVRETIAPDVRKLPPPLVEINGPKGPEPTRYGDWERKGRCVDF